jgi:cell wall-associated NlpC family hydrolase
MQFFNKQSFRLILVFALLASLIFATNIFSQPGAKIVSELQINTSPKDSIRPDTAAHFYKEEMIDSLIAFGKQFLGLAYHYGGQSPQGFDCSGYVHYLYEHFGYALPTSSSAMATVGTEVPYKEVRKGDILLFKGRNSASTSVGHVALVIEVDLLGLRMMHSCHRGVLIDRYPQIEYYRSRYLGARRVKL